MLAMQFKNPYVPAESLPIDARVFWYLISPVLALLLFATSVSPPFMQMLGETRSLLVTGLTFGWLCVALVGNSEWETGRSIVAASLRYPSYRVMYGLGAFFLLGMSWRWLGVAIGHDECLEKWKRSYNLL